MRLPIRLKTNFFATAVLFAFGAGPPPLLWAQSAPVIHLTAHREKLSTVLENFQQQSGIRLVFANSLVDSIQISIQITAAPEPALQKILQPTSFTFVALRPAFWVITPRPKTPSPSLRGRVVDVATQQPLAAAKISLPGRHRYAITDSLGYFEFEHSPALKQKLLVQRIGYQDSTFDLPSVENFSFPFKLALLVQPFLVPEMVVEGRRLPKPFGGNLLQQTLSDDQLNAPPLYNDGDLLALLHQQPGVSRHNLYDVFPHLEGGSATEVAIELDGMPVFTPTYGENRRSIFSTESVARLNLHRAGYNAALGEALSGIVELQTREIADSTFSTRLNVSLNGVAVSTRKNSPRLGWLGVGRSANPAGNLAFDGLKSHDLFNKLEYRVAPQKSLTLLSIASLGALTQSNSTIAPQLWNHSTGLRYTASSDSAQKFSLLFYRAALASRLQEFGVKIDARKKWTKALESDAGLHFFHLQSQGAAVSDSAGYAKYVWISFIEYNPRPTAIFKQTATLLAPYWNLAIGAKAWQAQIGLRVPYNFRQQIGRFEPRVAVNFSPHPNWDFTFAGGRYHQFTDRNYATEAKSGDTIGAGEYVVRDGERPPSRATHWRAEASYHLNPGWEVSLAFFRKDYQFHGQQYLYRLNHTFWLLPLQRGLSQGAEFWLGKILGRSQGWISYTRNHERYTGAANLSFRPYFNRDRLLSLGWLQHCSDRWRLQSAYVNATGFPKRDWNKNQISIEPGLAPEAIAQKYFVNAATNGAHQQMALGVSRRFSGPNRAWQLDLCIASTHAEQPDGISRQYFDCWAAVHFTR